MLRFSYGELFLFLGATAALIGPKDLPIIARTVGILAGRAISYVQLARGQFETVMQQSQARQVHKELQDTIAQLKAIRHEIRTILFMNPGPLTTRLVENLNLTSTSNGNSEPKKLQEKNSLITSSSSGSSNLHSQATTYERLAESTVQNAEAINELTNESSLVVFPISAESAGMLPNRRGWENTCISHFKFSMPVKVSGKTDSIWID